MGLGEQEVAGALIAGGVLVFLALPLAIWAGLYLMLGHAVFYRELKTLKGNEP